MHHADHGYTIRTAKRRGTHDAELRLDATFQIIQRFPLRAFFAVFLPVFLAVILAALLDLPAAVFFAGFAADFLTAFFARVFLLAFAARLEPARRAARGCRPNSIFAAAVFGFCDRS